MGPVGAVVEAVTTDDDWVSPYGFPFYPRLPATYRDVRAQYVFFTADVAAIAPLLPPPLTADPDGRCVVLGLEIPYSSAYGTFNEVVLEVGARLGDQAGWYCAVVLHDGPAGIAAGREVYGTPKVFSRIAIERTDRSMTTRGTLDGRPVIEVESTIGDEVDPSSLPSMAPSWRYKAIPRADRPGLAVKQLIDASSAGQQVEIATCRRGTGVVRFAAAPSLDLTGLVPRGYGDTFYVEMSYLEGYGTIAIDYLADRSGGSTP